MEVTYGSEQVVAIGAPITFNEIAVDPSCCMNFRQGSGIVQLRGMTNNGKARFFIDYNGNIALPTGETPAEISVALAIEGEPIETSRARVTPSTNNEFFNVSCMAYIDVPKGCCESVSIVNTSGTPITVANSNLVITREA